jgi:hypothetical protein
MSRRGRRQWARGDRIVPGPADRRGPVTAGRTARPRARAGAGGRHPAAAHPSGRTGVGGDRAGTAAAAGGSQVRRRRRTHVLHPGRGRAGDQDQRGRVAGAALRRAGRAAAGRPVLGRRRRRDRPGAGRDRGARRRPLPADLRGRRGQRAGAGPRPPHRAALRGCLRGRPRRLRRRVRGPREEGRQGQDLRSRGLLAAAELGGRRGRRRPLRGTQGRARHPARPCPRTPRPNGSRTAGT